MMLHVLHEGEALGVRVARDREIHQDDLGVGKKACVLGCCPVEPLFAS